MLNECHTHRLTHHRRSCALKLVKRTWRHGSTEWHAWQQLRGPSSDGLITAHLQVHADAAAVGALRCLPRRGMLAVPARAQHAHTAQSPAAARQQPPPGAS